MKLYQVVTLCMILTMTNLTEVVHSQIIEEPLYEKADRIIKGSPIIFEGVIIEQTFYESTPFNCWTANRIQITRIFKGFNQITCDEVILIHSGSSGQWLDFGQGLYYQDAPTHTVDFREGMQGIFFCKQNLTPGDHPNPPTNPTPNPVLKSSYEQYDNFLGYNYDPRLVNSVSLSTINHYADLFAGMTFDTPDKLANFIKSTYGIDTNDFVKCGPRPATKFLEAPEHPILINPKDFKSGKVQNDPQVIDDTLKSEPESDEAVELKGTKPKTGFKKKILDYEYAYNERLKNSLIPNASRANEDLDFTLENEKFTGTNPRYFEFDIMVSCNQTGTFIDNAPIHLSYNTNAFGSNIVANGKISVTLGNDFNDPTYVDPNTLSNDWASDTVVVILGFDYTTNPLNRTEAPTTPKKMLHVKIEMATCYQETDMFFVNQSIAGSVTAFTIASNEPWTGSIFIYDNVTYTGDLDLKLCEPVISSFTSPVHAGIKDILTITGKHFGASRGTGQVKLTDAESGGAFYIQTQDNNDYISWNDSEIKMYVPSRVESYQVGAQFANAGTGDFIVKTNLGDSAYSPYALSVHYSISNTPPIAQAGNNKLRLNLINDNNSGSYTFRCDTSVSNYPLRKAIVERAIHDWNCRTEVNWELGTDTTLQFFGTDGVNLIFFDNNLHGVPLARTQHFAGSACQTEPASQWKAFSREIDIAISISFDSTSNTNAYWWFDTTGANVPSNAFDFYGVLLHELGHAHAIKHVNDPVDPMYYSTQPGPFTANYRNYNPSKWYNLVDAGVDVVTTSEAIVYQCAQAEHMISAIESDCSIINKIKEVFKETGMRVYPNPTSSYSYINLTSDNLRGMRLYSVSGSLVYDFGYSKESQEFDSNIYLLNLETVPSGVYLLQIETDGGYETEKIIKQ